MLLCLIWLIIRLCWHFNVHAQDILIKMYPWKKNVMILNKQRQPLGTRAKWNWTWQVHAYEGKAGNASHLHEIFLWGHGTEEREKEDSSSRPGRASNFRATGRVPTGGTSRFIVNNINQQQPTRVYGTLNTCLELRWGPHERKIVRNKFQLYKTYTEIEDTKTYEKQFLSETWWHTPANNISILSWEIVQ